MSVPHFFYRIVVRYYGLSNSFSLWLQIREDAKTGVYVENLKEIEVKSVHDVVQLLIQVSVPLLLSFFLDAFPFILN